MKRIHAMLAGLLALCSAASGDLVSRHRAYYLETAGAGATPGRLGSIVYDEAEGAHWNERILRLPRPAEADLPSDAKADAILAADAAAKEVSRQAAKSVRLKGHERKLIDFLRAEGAIAAGAVSATPEQIDAMYANWDATLNDNQLERKSTKYTRLLEQVERSGGSEMDAYWQAP